MGNYRGNLEGWLLDTYLYKLGQANYNCSFIDVDELTPKTTQSMTNAYLVLTNTNRAFDSH